MYCTWAGFSDPHFNLVFGQELARNDPFMRPGYAVMFNVPEHQKEELNRKNIQLVKLPGPGDRTERLAAWLDSLMS